ncbi:hypothetical protein HispidOSU_017236 [Sigmodon hispidus]
MVVLKTCSLLLVSLFLAVGMGDKEEVQSSSLSKNSSEEDVLRDSVIQELLAWMVDEGLCQPRSQ